MEPEFAKLFRAPGKNFCPTIVANPTTIPTKILSRGNEYFFII
jgi:hypothetical protein